MDPLSALGLAAAVFQFVDFGSKIIHTTYNIHQSANGATQDNLELAELTKTLHNFQTRLATPQKASKGNDTDQKALMKLAARCRDIAADLLKLLDDLKVKVTDKGLRRTLQSLRQGFRSLLKKEQIAKYEKLLREINVQVNGLLLAMIRDDTSVISQRLTDLAGASGKSHLESQAALDGARKELVAQLERQSVAMMGLTAISNPGQANSASYHATLQSLPLAIQQLIEETRKISTIQRVLKSLVFGEIKLREEQIHFAYAKTFTWIFEDNTTSFKRWLTSSDGVFWVNGKAGSGKSTLMKFLASHETTKTLLRQWSGSGKLIVASFYFWSAGHDVQKSQLGLMKSLLYQIFRQCPDLIPPSWSSRFESVSAVDNKFDDWSRQELHDGIDSIVASGSLSSRFCFFVDGLDEYTDTHAGDHYILIQYLDHLAQSSHVKLCVSSRPWNVFKDRFDKHSDLKFVLQDLTSKDMLEYAMGQLQEDERFRRLASREPQALLLATQIRDKAEGVFLWVSLVTRSLKRGLSEHDDTKELERRLARTPSDLIEFFRSIFRNIDDNYKDHTMRALQIAAVGLPMPLGAFQYIPQELEDPTYVFRQEIRFDEPEVDLRAWTPPAALDVEAQVNKWCRDLLEVQHDEKARKNWLVSVPEGGVTFLHRTVHDFLLSKEMQYLFLEHSVCMPSSRKAACRMQLAYVKSLCSIPDVRYLDRGILEIAMLASWCERSDQGTPLDILCELKRTILALNAHPKVRRLHENSMLRLAVKTHILLYVEQASYCDVLAEPGILWDALFSILDPSSNWIDTISSLPMIAKLIGKGCSPNDICTDEYEYDGFVNESVWHKSMRKTYKHPDYSEASFWSYEDQRQVEAARIVELLLEHGADPDAKFEAKVSGGQFRSVDTRDFLLQVFHGDSMKVDALQKEARRVRSAAAGKKPGFFARFREILT